MTFSKIQSKAKQGKAKFAFGLFSSSNFESKAKQSKVKQSKVETQKFLEKFFQKSAKNFRKIKVKKVAANTTLEAS